MASKRIRKPPSRYVDDVVSPFVKHATRSSKSHLVFYPCSLDVKSATSSDNQDLLESSVEDEFIEDEVETFSEASRDCTIASSSVCDEISVCPWVDISPDHLPRLDLPSSSRDLLIDDSFLFDALEIYETCRNYYKTIRLSPFLFEDFCAALSSEEQTLLLAEIHIAFLKLALKSDEEEHITLSVQDTNNSFNIIVHLIEPMTYAEVLRQYVESDPRRFPREVLDALDGNYPFVDFKRRITVLSWLCDRFLHSEDFRNIIRNEGKIVSDQHCRECGKQGDVLLCDGCEACYHLKCAHLTEVPEGRWLCQVCLLHEVPGVTDCGQLCSRSHRLPFRSKPLGYDRHGRRYWFAVRRIIVEDDEHSSVCYYSTLPQLYALLSRFAVGDLEKHLAVTIMNILPKINEEMRKTQELTEEFAARFGRHGESFLLSNNLDRMADVFSQPLACTSFESDDERTVVCFEGKPVEISKTMLLTKVEELLGFREGLFSDLFWTAGWPAEKVLARRNTKDIDRAVASVSEHVAEDHIQLLGFRLGENGGYREYQNQYSINDYTKAPQLRAKERDRKKYLCNRFSLADEGAFEWSIPKGQYLYGCELEVANIIQHTIYRFSQRIPSVLMHRLWRKDGLDSFTKDATAPIATVELLRDLLLRFECGIRKPVMGSVFWGTLGHTRLIRLTAEDRELKQMVDAKKKKMDRELVIADVDDEESDVVWVKYTKLGGPPKHNIWRLKDEQYRVNGRGGLSGWLWVSKSMRRDIRLLPEKPPLGITTKNDTQKLQSASAKKAYHLAKVVDKLLGWRQKAHAFEVEEALKSVRSKCFSPTCRNEISCTFASTSSPMDRQEHCYSSICRKENAEGLSQLTRSVVLAHDPHRRSRAKEDNGESKKVMGEDIPFPLPVPFNFRVRRTNEQSLLVLPQKFLKRLARQGGLRPDFFAPGFHRIAKSNMHVWNYPCQRPLFDHCWRYLTLRARSYHAVALQLRILYACIRWADMERDEDEDEHVTIHHPDHDEVRIVIGHKEFPPDGLYERYKLKVQLIPLEDPNDAVEETGEDEEGYRPGRAIDLTKSARKRKVVSKVKDAGHNGIRNASKMKILEKWIDGVELKLWEIVAYWKSRDLKRSERRERSARTAYAGMAEQKHIALTPRVPAKRRPQPKRLPEYDYDVSDDERRSVKKPVRYEYHPRVSYSRESSTQPDSRESSYSDSRVSTQYVLEKPVYYTSQRANVFRKLSPYSVGNSDLYNSESPFNPRFRMRCRVFDAEENEHVMVQRRDVGFLHGGGKSATEQDAEQSASNVSPLPAPDDVERPGSRSPIDEPPLIPRYDNTNYDEMNHPQERVDVRSVPLQQRRVIYLSPSNSPASVRPLARKVLMIRGPDGTKRFVRPIAQSTAEDDRGQTRTVITTAQVGGSTMSEARGTLGLNGGTQRVISGGTVFASRQFNNRSLVDHAGLVQQRRVVPTIRGRPAYGQPQTRIVRVAPSNASQPSTSSAVYSPASQLRVQSSSLGNGMVIAEKDPFMKRMAAEKAISGSSVTYTSSPGSSIRRRPSGRDTYAGYYGEKSNDRIDVEEYQMLAEQGYRPPGRPPGRLASTFGYGPRVNQQRAILLSRGGRGGLTTRYGPDATVVVSPATGRYDAGTPRVVPSPAKGITTIGTFSGGQYRVRNVATYKEYCLRKGIDWTGERFRRQLARPVRFEFESNEEEERAIAEAIAKEEELMRLEEERKRISMGISVETDLTRFEEFRRKEWSDSLVTARREVESLRISSVSSRRTEENLAFRESDSPEVVEIKQVLSELISQVCRWDKDYNWHKNLLRRAKERHDADRYYRAYKTPKSRQKQLEIDLNERMDRFRKEVNKRRVRLEGTVELEVGMVVPWRRPRGRPNKAIRQQYMAASSQPIVTSSTSTDMLTSDAGLRIKKEVKAEMVEVPTVIDPADISLSDAACIVRPMNDVKQEIAKSETSSRSHPVKPIEDVAFTDKTKEKSKERKKGTENAKKAVSTNQSSTSVQRGRGRPRKEADDSPKPSASSSSQNSKIELQTSQSTSDLAKLCVCNKPFDPKAFHVGCSSCYRWFHGKCVSITEKKWNKIKDWTCPGCSQQPKTILYCLCQTPYDDSRFYVGCDRCEGWYHPQCVGITQAEAEAMAEYICPSCKSNEAASSDPNISSTSSVATILTRKDYDLIGQLLSTIRDQRASWPFKERVDEKEYPDYYAKITRPMDLSVVDNKIEQLRYQKLEEFLADMNLIFENARVYHNKSSAIYRCADTLEKKFNGCFTKVKKQIDLRNRERLRVSESKTADSLDINTDELFPIGSDFDASLFDDII